MMTVKQVSKLTGVSVRTLQYYDSIGLLSPHHRTEAGYRMYDDTDLEKLQQILLFRELEFPLKDIIRIVSSTDFDRKKALEQQINLLELKMERLGNIIDLARKIKETGVKTMDLSVFDNTKIKEYAEKAKKEWGNTDAYKEFESRDHDRSDAEKHQEIAEFMELFAEFGRMHDKSPDSEEVQSQVKKLQEHITDNYYTCTHEILLSLGKMYASGGEFTENIDKAGGKGTAVFVSKAIEYYCK